MTGECCICQNYFDDVDDLRPYGPDGKPICFDCSQSTTELRQEAEKRMGDLLQGLFDQGRVIILGGGEPRILCKLPQEN